MGYAMHHLAPVFTSLRPAWSLHLSVRRSCQAAYSGCSFLAVYVMQMCWTSRPFLGFPLRSHSSSDTPVPFLARLFLPQTSRTQLCGLGNLLTLRCATCVGFDLLSATSSGAGMEEGYGFVEIKNCFGFSVVQAGACEP